MTNEATAARNVGLTTFWQQKDAAADPPGGGSATVGARHNSRASTRWRLLPVFRHRSNLCSTILSSLSEKRSVTSTVTGESSLST